MCDAVGVGLAVGALSAAANVSQAQSEADYQNAVAEQKYKLAQRDAERNNQIASQKYQNDLRIVGRKDEQKARDYERRLKAWEEALNANVRQSTVNARSATLARAEIGLKSKAAGAKAAFDSQAAVAKMIQQQGELLATGMSGQSFLLQTTQPSKSLGFTNEKINEIFLYERLGFGLELQGVDMDYFSAENTAYNNLPAGPVAEQASLLPYVPILDPGPAEPIERSPNIGAAILGGFASGVAAGGAVPT